MSALRDEINNVYKTSLKQKQQTRVNTLRLILAALKDRDINARSSGNQDGINDTDILTMLQSMIKQRGESIRMYNEGGRPELAQREQEEIDIIQEFLPQQLDEDELKTIITETAKSVAAQSIKDMGKIMAVLKTDYAGQVDMKIASKLAKEVLDS